MTIEEIRANAPSGATHYEVDGRFIYYYKLDGCGFYILDRKERWMKKPIEWLCDTKPL